MRHVEALKVGLKGSLHNAAVGPIEMHEFHVLSVISE